MTAFPSAQLPQWKTQHGSFDAEGRDNPLSAKLIFVRMRLIPSE